MGGGAEAYCGLPSPHRHGLSQGVVPVKVLALVASGRTPDNSVMYDALAQRCDLRLVMIDKRQEKRLFWHLRGVDCGSYDAVLANLRFKGICKQTRFLAEIPNLFFLEWDACQNYMPTSKWHGRFSAFYRKLPKATALCTGAALARQLAAEGINAHFVPKGYDHCQIGNQGGPRDIEMAFIGSLGNVVYAERKAFLETLQARQGLQLLRTNPGPEYAAMLNRIRFFVSADLGLGEYMGKNFEAMGAGCVLCAYRQPEEEAAMGLKDMQHLVLYSCAEELMGKVAALQSDRSKLASIQRAGQQHAVQHLSYAAQAKAIFSCIAASHRGPVVIG